MLDLSAPFAPYRYVLQSLLGLRLLTSRTVVYSCGTSLKAGFCFHMLDIRLIGHLRIGNKISQRNPLTHLATLWCYEIKEY